MSAKFLRGVDLNGNRATGAADGTSATDLVTLQQLQAAIRGLDWKDSVRAASTGNLTLSGTQTVDGVALVANDRVLVKDQTTGSANGIYTVQSGAWTRAIDADSSAEVTGGMAVTVTEGTTNGDKAFILTTNDPITLGTTALTFTQLGGSSPQKAAGNGLTEDGSSYHVGAGNGIVVTADAVAVDTNVVTRKYAADCAATTNPQNFTHGLGTADLQVSVYEKATGVLVFPDVTVTSTQITVDFGGAPTAAQYRVAAVG